MVRESPPYTLQLRIRVGHSCEVVAIYLASGQITQPEVLAGTAELLLADAGDPLQPNQRRLKLMGLANLAWKPNYFDAVGPKLDQIAKQLQVLAGNCDLPQAAAEELYADLTSLRQAIAHCRAQERR